MKRLLALFLILINASCFSQVKLNKWTQTKYVGGTYQLQQDTLGNGVFVNVPTLKYLQDYVTAHGGNSYVNGYGLNLTSNIFSVDTTTIAYKTWAAARATLMSAGYGLTGGGSLAANRTFVVDSATLAQYFVRRKDSFNVYYPFQSNPLSYLTNILGYAIAGSGVTITGLGTPASPLIISATGGGGGGATNVNVGSGYRWALPNTNNIKTYFTGLWLLTDSTTNANAITTKVDSATVSTYYVRRKDSVSGGYYPYASNPANYTTAAAIAGIYVPLTRLVNAGVGLLGGGALSSNITLRADTTYLLYQLPQVTTLTVSKNGSDATGIRGRLDKPFLTIRGALNASSSGDLIIVYPGTYEEASPISLAHNVNFQFVGKGTVQLTTSLGSAPVFTDSTTVSTSTIIAHGWKFEGRSTQNVLNILAASTIKMYVDELLGSGNGRVINMGTNSNLTITANRVAGNAFSAQIWLSSAAHFYGDIKLLECSTFGEGIWISNTKSVVLNSDKIFVSDSTNDDYLLYIDNSNATDSIYINANEIQSGTEWALWGKGNSPAIHVKAQHISAKSDCVVVSGTNPGGVVYVDADVIENRTTGAMDGIIHGEGGTIVVSRARVIRNPLATGGDIKTSIFGGDTGYVKLIGVAFDPTHINEVPSGTVTRIDNYFHSGLKLKGLTLNNSAPYTLGYDSTGTDEKVYMVTNPTAGRALTVALTDAATITTDASLGYTFGATYRVTLGGNRTIANPTNMVDGQRIVYELHQDVTGGRLITWGGKFTWSDDLPLPTLSTIGFYVDQVAFVYNQSADKFYVSGINKGIH